MPVLQHDDEYPNPDSREYLRVDQVARMYNVTVDTVWRWVRSGRLEQIRTPGGSIRIPIHSINRFCSPLDNNKCKQM